MREVIEVLKSESGLPIKIYEVKNYKLSMGEMYHVDYKLGNSNQEFESRLVSTTEGERTLIFNHPDLVNKTIGIPNWNINKLTRI
jgi:predicted RNA methylase